MTKPTPIPERLNRLEEEVARLKLAYVAKRRGLADDDPALIEAIVKDVRVVREQLFTELYGQDIPPSRHLR